MSGPSFWVSELIERGNIQIISLKKFGGGGGGGLFDYSVTPGPCLVKIQLPGAWFGQARVKARAKELDNLPLISLKKFSGGGVAC